MNQFWDIIHNSIRVQEPNNRYR